LIEAFEDMSYCCTWTIHRFLPVVQCTSRQDNWWAKAHPTSSDCFASLAMTAPHNTCHRAPV
jgi:hypothetical protein